VISVSASDKCGRIRARFIFIIIPVDITNFDDKICSVFWLKTLKKRIVIAA
jgi:hypothetical protein